MAIQVEHRIDDGVLRVTATGFDESLQQVEDYGQTVIAVAAAHDCTRIICDETGLKYTLSTINTYELAKFLSVAMPKVARVAIICSPQQAKDADFWETVAVNRGLQVRVFKDEASAEAWI